MVEIPKHQQIATEPQETSISARLTGRLWQRFSALYGRQWESSCGSIGGEVFETWRQSLAKLDAQKIKRGLDALITEGGEFPPNLIKFIKLCKTVIPVYHKPAILPALPSPDRKHLTDAAKERHLEAVKKLYGT